MVLIWILKILSKSQDILFSNCLIKRLSLIKKIHLWWITLSLCITWYHGSLQKSNPNHKKLTISLYSIWISLMKMPHCHKNKNLTLLLLNWPWETNSQSLTYHWMTCSKSNTLSNWFGMVHNYMLKLTILTNKSTLKNSTNTTLEN